jgi:invasion protein IalB
MAKIMSTLSMVVIAAIALASGPLEAARRKADAVPAPIAAPAPQPVAAPIQWDLKSTFGKWALLCNKENPSDCRAAQTQNYSDDMTQGRLLQVLLDIEQGRLFAVMTLPFGVDLRAGAVIKIDDGAEVKAVYNTCLPDGCQAIVELDENLQSQFNTGKIMKVGFRPWGGDEKTFVVDVPLEGAKDALTALKR